MNECPFKHMRPCDFQLKMTHGKWNHPSFLVLEQFLSVFIFLRPLSSELTFLIKSHAIELLALQKSEILGNFGFLERHTYLIHRKRQHYITRFKTRRDKKWTESLLNTTIDSDIRICITPLLTRNSNLSRTHDGARPTSCFVMQ